MDGGQRYPAAAHIASLRVTCSVWRVRSTAESASTGLTERSCRWYALAMHASRSAFDTLSPATRCCTSGSGRPLLIMPRHTRAKLSTAWVGGRLDARDVDRPELVDVSEVTPSHRWLTYPFTVDPRGCRLNHSSRNTNPLASGPMPEHQRLRTLPSSGSPRLFV